MTIKPTKPDTKLDEHYDSVLGNISNVIDAARSSAARSINCIMTAAYGLIGRRIVEYEQGGKAADGRTRRTVQSNDHRRIEGQLHQTHAVKTIFLFRWRLV